MTRCRCCGILLGRACGLCGETHGVPSLDDPMRCTYCVEQGHSEPMRDYGDTGLWHYKGTGRRPGRPRKIQPEPMSKDELQEKASELFAAGASHRYVENELGISHGKSQRLRAKLQPEAVS